jgi:NADH-quinone oxidoreductase subunit C
MQTAQLINVIVPSVLISHHGVEIEYQTTSKQLLILMQLLKSHTLTQFKTLTEMTAVDTQGNTPRFYVTYFLLSTDLNMRARVSLQTNDIQPVMSITSLFSSAD